MKTKAILATLLVAAAANADARFAWPYPPKAVSPDEIGHTWLLELAIRGPTARSATSPRRVCPVADRTV